jgi:hypothetical protein
MALTQGCRQNHHKLESPTVRLHPGPLLLATGARPQLPTTLGLRQR